MTLLPEDPGDRRQTPPDLFDKLNDEFNFTVDVAADETNHKCAFYFSRGGDGGDGLESSWDNLRVWCNPPYSDIESWVRKAWREQNPLTVMLIPNDRTEQAWWQDLIESERDSGGCLTTRFLRGRVKFWPASMDGPGPKNVPKCGSVLLIWRR